MSSRAESGRIEWSERQDKTLPWSSVDGIKWTIERVKFWCEDISSVTWDNLFDPNHQETTAGGRDPLDWHDNWTFFPDDKGRFKLVIRTSRGRTVFVVRENVTWDVVWGWSSWSKGCYFSSGQRKRTLCLLWVNRFLKEHPKEKCYWTEWWWWCLIKCYFNHEMMISRGKGEENRKSSKMKLWSSTKISFLRFSLFLSFKKREETSCGAERKTSIQTIFWWLSPWSSSSSSSSFESLLHRWKECCCATNINIEIVMMFLCEKYWPEGASSSSRDVTTSDVHEMMMTMMILFVIHRWIQKVLITDKWKKTAVYILPRKNSAAKKEEEVTLRVSTPTGLFAWLHPISAEEEEEKKVRREGETVSSCCVSQCELDIQQNIWVEMGDHSKRRRVRESSENQATGFHKKRNNITGFRNKKSVCLFSGHFRLSQLFPPDLFILVWCVCVPHPTLSSSIRTFC